MTEKEMFSFSVCGRWVNLSGSCKTPGGRGGFEEKALHTRAAIIIMLYVFIHTHSTDFKNINNSNSAFGNIGQRI